MTISVFAIGITVSADEAEASNKATYVYYSGQKLDSATPYLLMGKAADATSTTPITVKASAADNDSDGTWSVLAQFDAQTGTLTFKSGRDITANPWDVGMSLKQIDTNGDGDTSNEKYYGIYANGNLTVDLGSYVNLLYLERQQPKDFGQEGIHVEGNLTVNGTQKGMLRVTANPAGKQNGSLQSYGVYASGNVILNGGIIDVYETTWHLDSNPFYLHQNYTTLIKANDVKLNGGSLYLRARNNSASLATNKKLHDIGAENTDAINVPDSYNQQWASQFEYAPDRTDGGTDQDRIKGNDGNTTFNTSKTDGDVYVKYAPIDKGFRIKVMGQELGGDKKYLHIGDNNTVTVSDVSEDASAEYDITRDSEGTITKELKFLKDTSLSYKAKGIANIIESDSDLTVNINNKKVALYSAAEYEWPYTRATCVYVSGDLTITGGGSLVGRIEGDAVEDKDNASDRFASAVIYSGGELKFGDVDATLFIARERDGATSAKYPQSNVIYANKLTVGTDASLKLRKRLAPADNEAAGYLIGGVTEAKVSIPNAADSFTGNIEIDNTNAYDWKGNLKASDKLYDYTYDNMKTSTYMEVSTADKTVAVTSIGLNNDNVVDPTANTVKITLAKADESAADPDVFVIAAASDANGVLTSVASFSGKANGDKKEMIIGGGSSVKVYVWSTSDGLKPLKKVRTYYAAETTDTTVTD